VTDLPSLVNMMITVIKPIKIRSRIMLKRFIPALGSFIGRLALVRELVYTTDVQLFSSTQTLNKSFTNHANYNAHDLVIFQP